MKPTLNKVKRIVKDCYTSYLSGAIYGLMIAVLTTFTPGMAGAQNFDDGLNLFEQGRYEEALSVFQELDSPQARLFEGKSYFSLGQYLKAKAVLDLAQRNSVTEIYREALYTSALADFQLRQFGSALSKLEKVSNASIQTPLITEAINLYDDILNYLTLEQRRQAYQEVSSSKIKYDLIRSAMGKVTYPTAKLLIREFRNTVPDSVAENYIEDLNRSISDSLNYAMQIAFGQQLETPNGTIYNIGVALPSYEPGDRDFGVSQGLYFGHILAAEEFNQQNPDKKAFIRYNNTGANKDSSEYLMTSLAWNYNVDAILGPLYSEPAVKLARLAELYQIPMLAPLANSDTLNVDNPYFYLANPTFASHGRKMAEFAVNELNMDTLGVLAERNSLGEASAFAFRDRAEKLGAKVAHFFVEDLESQGYEITEYSKYFITDSASVRSRSRLTDSLRYSGIDGLYAPFTGQAAPTLIDLLLIDLNAMNSKISILGSQEWGATEIPEDRLQNRNIYFSESYFLNTKSDRVERFREDYRNRFGVEANRFAMIGYDAAIFLLNTLEEVKNPALLKNALSTQPLYEGIIGNIKFGGKHVNQEVKIFKLSREGIQPAKY